MRAFQHSPFQPVLCKTFKMAEHSDLWHIVVDSNGESDR